MQRSLVTANLSQLLRHSALIGNPGPVFTQIRHGSAHNLAVRRSVDRKIEELKKLPYLATSRDVVKEDGEGSDRIALSKDGRVIACLHPEVPFPYEMTKPIPLDITPTDSNLKLQALVPVREVFRQKHRDLVVQELMRLTHTSKHRWYCVPRRLERLKKLDVNKLNQERDREYL